MKTAEEHFEERNGGKSASSELITELYAIDLMKSFADQQNKELRDRIAKYDEIPKLIGLDPKVEDWAAEIQRLKERNKYLEEHSNERFELANELNDQDQEIQRLRGLNQALAEELTRLRELLSKSREWISQARPMAGWMPESREEMREHITEIDNALNHKP